MFYNKGPFIIHNGKRGGLGHKTNSLLHSITYALLLQRPLRSNDCEFELFLLVYMPESYWNSVDSCFTGLRYDEGINSEMEELLIRF